MRRQPAALLACVVGAALLAACKEEVPVIPPKQMAGSPFHYPEDLWDAGVEGETVLRLFVTPDGGVDTIRLERSSEHAAFDSAAVSGARDLRFEPARQGPDPVGAWVLLPVQFDLPGADTARGGAP